MKLYHAKIVLPDQVIDNGYVSIEGDIIREIGQGNPQHITSDDINAEGNWLIPGLIDSHSDAIEIEIEPRPTSRFPVELSFAELEKKLVGEGITTIFHAVSLLKRNTVRWARENDTAYDLIEDIHRLASEQHMIRHKTHLRYEITNVDAAEKVSRLIADGKIDQFSLTDHTPGQGQYRDLEVQMRLLVDHRHYSKEEALKIVNDTQHQAKLDPQSIVHLAHLAEECGIPVASHDDDTIDKLNLIREWKASISEFPITLDVARYAKQMGLYVVMGAPNLLLGRSHSKNLSARTAVSEGLVDMLCSDYYPSSLLHAAFQLHYELGLSVPYAINMVTLNPAKALKLDHELGSIETGKKADLLLVAANPKNKPLLRSVFVDGKQVCHLSYLTASAHALANG
ncbi:MAG: alpha-D-ribose 1-methylphosphonate 5-triphosphate diphosphatase [Sporolactobacillus sp.]